MKIRSLFVCFLTLLLCLSLLSCGKTPAADELWQDARYTADTAFGEGEKTVTVTVTAGEKSVVFTVRTDADTLGEVLLAHGLIEGDDGPYGLYIKKVNGILADYDVNGRYWAFSKDGTSMMTGVDGATIADGDRYELTYAK